jgi:hypothetical protein
MGGAYGVLVVEEPAGKIPLGRPGCLWENNIKTDLEEIRWEDVDGTDLALERNKWQTVVNTEMNFLVP